MHGVKLYNMIKSYINQPKIAMNMYFLFQHGIFDESLSSFFRNVDTRLVKIRLVIWLILLVNTLLSHLIWIAPNFNFRNTNLRNPLSKWLTSWSGVRRTKLGSCVLKTSTFDCPLMPSNDVLMCTQLRSRSILGRHSFATWSTVGQ